MIFSSPEIEAKNCFPEFFPCPKGRNVLRRKSHLAFSGTILAMSSAQTIKVNRKGPDKHSRYSDLTIITFWITSKTKGLKLSFSSWTTGNRRQRQAYQTGKMWQARTFFSDYQVKRAIFMSGHQFNQRGANLPKAMLPNLKAFASLRENVHQLHAFIHQSRVSEVHKRPELRSSLLTLVRLRHMTKSKTTMRQFRNGPHSHTLQHSIRCLRKIALNAFKSATPQLYSGPKNQPKSKRSSQPPWAET